MLFIAFEKPTRGCFFQILREVKLLIIKNVPEKNWAMHLQRTGLKCSIHSTQRWPFKNAFPLSNSSSLVNGHFIGNIKVEFTF